MRHSTPARLRIFLCMMVLGLTQPAPPVQPDDGAASRRASHACLTGLFEKRIPKKDDAAWQNLIRSNAGWVRGPVFVWQALQPGPANWSKEGFAAIDAALARVAKAGARPVGILRCVSSWGIDPAVAAVNAPRKTGFVSGAPKDAKAWADFVTALLDRYDGDGKCPATEAMGAPPAGVVVDHWQIDPEYPDAWGGKPEAVADYVKATAEAIHAANPAARVILGGLSAAALDACAFAETSMPGKLSFDGKEVMKDDLVKSEKYAALRKWTEIWVRDLVKLVDIVDVHLSCDYQNVRPRLEWLRKKMWEHQAGRPLWVLEIGAPPGKAGEAVPPDVAAFNVPKLMCAAMARGAEVVAFSISSDIQEKSPGRASLAMSDGEGQPRPALMALRVAGETLEGATQVEQIETAESSTYVFKITTPRGLVHWVWDDKSSGVSLPVFTEKARLRQVDGTQKDAPIKEGEVYLSLSVEPVCMEEVK